MWKNVLAEVVIGAFCAACVGAIIAIARVSGLNHSDAASLVGAAFGAGAAAGVAIWVEERRRRQMLNQARELLLASVDTAKAAIASINGLMEEAPVPATAAQNLECRAYMVDLLAAVEAIDTLKDQVAMLDLKLMNRCQRISAIWTMYEPYFESLRTHAFNVTGARTVLALWEALADVLEFEDHATASPD